MGIKNIAWWNSPLNIAHIASLAFGQQSSLLQHHAILGMFSHRQIYQWLYTHGLE